MNLFKRKADIPGIQFLPQSAQTTSINSHAHHRGDIAVWTILQEQQHLSHQASLRFSEAERVALPFRGNAQGYSHGVTYLPLDLNVS